MRSLLEHLSVQLDLDTATRTTGASGTARLLHDQADI